MDEVGRGALFGPVCAGAVIMNPQRIPSGINDSKTLSPRQRSKLADDIREAAEASAVAFVDASTIDRINILEATRRAMVLAVEKLETRPDFLLSDGDMVVPIPLPQQSIVGGDRRSLSIAAASILAKVARDRLIVNLDARYPGYDLRNNMGYGTRKHREALMRLGPTPLHRASFRGVCGLNSADPGSGVDPEEGTYLKQTLRLRKP
ncbi:MAG: ribonuclease HII [Acidobacteriota bacterium]|nr:ribonuclease HII [Acidobacteriota bacterium]